VVSGASSVGISNRNFDSSSARFSSGSFSPVVDWFVAKGWSLGLTAGLSYSDNQGYGSDGSLVDTQSGSVRVGPRVGYDLQLSRTVSLWPTFDVGLEWVWQNQFVVSGSSASVAGNHLGYPNSTGLGPWVALDVALLWHIAPHFFVGVQPEAFHAFATSAGGPNVGGQQSSVGGGLLVGGWLGGPRGPDEVDPAGERGVGPAPRFGTAGQIALDSELSLGAGWTSFQGSPAQSSSGYADAALDYFVVDHVSLGAGVSGSLIGITGVDSTTGMAVTTQSKNAGVFVRMGADMPVAERVSFWPRVSLGYAWGRIDQTEGPSSTEIDDAVYLSLYAPVLVHPASHFFIGFGPSLARDLSQNFIVSRSPDGGAFGPTRHNASTTVGAGLTVGGWL
jgi:hypothetical protein